MNFLYLTHCICPRVCTFNRLVISDSTPVFLWIVCFGKISISPLSILFRQGYMNSHCAVIFSQPLYFNCLFSFQILTFLSDTLNFGRSHSGIACDWSNLSFMTIASSTQATTDLGLYWLGAKSTLLLLLTALYGISVWFFWVFYELGMPFALCCLLWK